MIKFNKPYFTGLESVFIQEAIQNGRLSGNGPFTGKCQQFFEQRYGFKKILLTQSCTAALEMAALLIECGPDDEVIIPSYTFVSTANAFALRGSKLVFADSNSYNPNIDADQLEALITPKTKAIVVVHYAGIACDMDKIMAVAKAHKLFVIEDAAQGVDSFHNQRPLGSIGHLAAFSFHETKNIISGEGGMLAVNDERFIKRAEILWEKGTNRSAFFRGEVDKYNWIDVGSSFLPSELTAAFLWAQLQSLGEIQTMRKAIWDFYYQSLLPLQDVDKLLLPKLPDYSTNNAHLFYVATKDHDEYLALTAHLKAHEVQAVFHYLPLHKSPYIESKGGGPQDLPLSDYFGATLLRLPLYPNLSLAEQQHIVSAVNAFYEA
jgi:dTDP-4-amino-4,6-dideoxygalactose transaminase